MECSLVSPVPQVKIEPKDSFEDDLAGANEPTKTDSVVTEEMILEHDAIFIKTEKNDSENEQEEEDVVDPFASLDPAQQNADGPPRIPKLECVDVKVEPTSSCEAEMAQTGELRGSECEYINVERISPRKPEPARTGKKPFKCTQCGRGTDRKLKLRQLVESRLAKKELKCSACDSVGSRRDHIAVRIRKPEGPVLRCPYCDFTCNGTKLLKFHLFQHTAKKVWRCSECDYVTVRKCNLKKHMILRRHGDVDKIHPSINEV